ncbi:hypothetical protein BD408DRAFT_419795 [Parasitella parasitica]|nr:hypothetical protein BD408DRAFT_419795 [Parasitella parasitica]
MLKRVQGSSYRKLNETRAIMKAIVFLHCTIINAIVTSAPILRYYTFEKVGP